MQLTSDAKGDQLLYELTVAMASPIASHDNLDVNTYLVKKTSHSLSTTFRTHNTIIATRLTHQQAQVCHFQ